jgi:hypothetical protein
VDSPTILTHAFGLVVLDPFAAPDGVQDRRLLVRTVGWY